MSVVPGPAPFVAMALGRARTPEPFGDRTPVPTVTDEAFEVVPRPRISPERDGGGPSAADVGIESEPDERAGSGGERVYADGSALSRYLEGAPCRAEWLAWAARHESELVTTPLSLTELRAIAGPRGIDARGVANDVADRLEVMRISDQVLRHAAKVSGVVSAFHALHVGAAVAHPEVHAVATYDMLLAQVCVLFGLDVVSPGWPDRWWERE